MKLRIIQRFFFVFATSLLFLRAHSDAEAHGAFDCSSEMTVHESKIEIAITMGLEAARHVLAKAGLSSDAIAEAIKTRGPYSSVDLSPAVSSSFFELTSGEEILAAQSVTAISDGIEATFNLTYQRPAAGILDVRAVYHNGIEEIRRGPFIARDEAMNQLGTAMLSRANTSVLVQLPSLGNSLAPMDVATQKPQELPSQPALSNRRLSVLISGIALLLILTCGGFIAWSFLNRRRTDAR